jgi:hypothetical protein
VSGRARARILFYPAADLGWSASHIASTVLPGLRGCYAIGDGKSIDGVRTQSAARKMLYMERALGLITDDAVRLMTEPVIANPLAAGGDRPPAAETLAEFEEQLHRFKKLTYMPNVATQATRLTVSGKCDESGKVVRGQRDDLVMAMLLAMWWEKEYKAGRTTQPAVLKRSF